MLDKTGEAHIPCGPYLELDEVSRDPHVKATGMVDYMDMEEPGLEKVPVSNTPFKLSKTPARMERRAPRVAEHNEEVYSGLLGYSSEFINALENQGTI